MQATPKPTVVIGADAARCDLVLDRPSVSGRHCHLSRGPQGLLATDLGSSNGTFVDGVRLEPHRPWPVALGAASTCEVGLVTADLGEIVVAAIAGVHVGQGDEVK